MTLPSDPTTPLSELIDRVERAEWPDREIDAEIFAIAYGRRITKVTIAGGGAKGKVVDSEVCPLYTASLNSIVGLIERELPEANCHGYDKDPVTVTGYVSLNSVPSGHWLVECDGKTPALAMCGAFLKAKARALSARGGK